MKFQLLESELRSRITFVEADSEQDVWDGNYTVIAHGKVDVVEVNTVDVEEDNDVKRYLRFTDYDGRDDGSLLVIGWQAGLEQEFVQSEVMPMWSADIDDEDGYWTVISDKLGRITFQSIDIEEDN